MPAAGVVMIIAVVAIIVAVVYYLMMTIVALIRIRNDLDEAISGVTGIIDKTAPLNEVVPTINQNLDAGVDLLEGLLVKKAGMEDAVGLVDGLYPDARQGRPDSMPRSPIIGTDSPNQYVPSESPGVRKRMPVAVGAAEPPPAPEPSEGGLAKSGLAFLRRFKKED